MFNTFVISSIGKCVIDEMIECYVPIAEPSQRGESL